MIKIFLFELLQLVERAKWNERLDMDKFAIILNPISSMLESLLNSYNGTLTSKRTSPETENISQRLQKL